MISPKKYQEYAADPATFRADLLVDVDGVVRRFGDVMDQWQRDDFASIDPALMRCNGRAENPDAKMRVYLERGRGHSKTTDIGVNVAWALIFATRPLKGYGFAADKDQAGLVLDTISTLIRLNVWMASILEVQKSAVVNIAKGHPGYGSTFEIFASDVGSSYGILPDFIVADEFTHWEGDGALWHSIISSAAKRSSCVLWTITNAGVTDTWQWLMREAARQSEDWIFSRLDGPVASWFTEARLAEQRRMLPKIVYERLWNNNWTSGCGNALDDEDINAAINRELKPGTLRDGDVCIAGLDLGVKQDHSALVIVACNESTLQMRLVYAKSWKPSPTTGKVDLIAVEQDVLNQYRRFGLDTIGYDPYQAALMAQRLEANGVPMQEMTFTGANLTLMASTMIDVFRSRRLELYEHSALIDDLSRLTIEEKSYGYRLSAIRNQSGHADLATALAIALPIAVESAGSPLPPALAGMDGKSSSSYADYWNARLAEYEAEQQFQNELALRPEIPEFFIRHDLSNF